MTPNSVQKACLGVTVVDADFGGSILGTAWRVSNDQANDLAHVLYLAVRKDRTVAGSSLDLIFSRNILGADPGRHSRHLCTKSITWFVHLACLCSQPSPGAACKFFMTHFWGPMREQHPCVLQH